MKRVINFRKADKMLSGKIIRKMRTEDIRSFYIKNKKHMNKSEKNKFENIFFNKSSKQEYFVERKGNKLIFISLD